MKHITELQEKDFRLDTIKKWSFKEFKAKMDHWVNNNPKWIQKPTEKEVAELYERLTGAKVNLKEKVE
jgi:hypothetical protein